MFDYFSVIFICAEVLFDLQTFVLHNMLLYFIALLQFQLHYY